MAQLNSAMQRRRFHARLGFVLVWLTLAATVNARAGGGGHFSSGGHSSGGHSSGGHSSGGGGHSFGGGHGGSQGDPTVFLIIFAIIIAIIVINAWLDSQRKQTVRRGAAALDQSAANQLAERLKQNDPSFDAPRFGQRGSQAFLKIQAGWSAQDLRSLQPFVSDGVMERFSLQIREQQALGYRDQMEQVRVDAVLLVNVVQSDIFESATLRIDASAIDYEASLSGGQFVRGSRVAEPFTEYWTFLRRRGTASVAGDGLIEGRCPNCGAAIEINQNVTCAHCGAVLRSGRYDWVLCEITQASEWRPREARPVPGYDALRAADAGLSLDDLEDRASVIFWRRAEADRTNNPAALRNVALDVLLAARAQNVGNDSSAWQWFGDVGVGSVDTLALTRGDDFDRAIVRIAWSGTAFTQRADGRVSRGGETSVIRETLILARQPGVASDPDKGITSSHCPSCGAPVSSSAGNGCESCGRVLNDGSAGWVLESIESGASDRVAALLREARSLTTDSPSAATVVAAPPTPSARGLLIWAIKIAAADGEIDAKERSLIARFAGRAGVTAADVEALVVAARADRLDAPLPDGRDETTAWLTAMIGVAMVDGRLARGEAALIQSVADRAGMSSADIRLLINKEQSRIVAAARAAARNSSRRSIANAP